jgi:hypothetical protein
VRILPSLYDFYWLEPEIIYLKDYSNFQRFLLDSPEMTDEEFQAIEEKRRHLNKWV